MTGRHEDNSAPSVSARELDSMREDELLAFIEETVIQLNKLGDRLESYAKDRIPKKKGDTSA